MTMYVPTGANPYLNLVMRTIAESAAPTQAMYDTLKKEYDAICKALDDCPQLAPYQPKLWMQGSMALGVTIRSPKNDGDMDVDVIVELKNVPDFATQKWVKELVLKTLKSHPVYGKMLDKPNGGRRCVTICYANNSHVDLLPCVTSDAYYRSIQMNDANVENYSLAITDKQHAGYDWDTNQDRWPHSNPLGFIKWFNFKASTPKTAFVQSHDLTLKAEISPFPKYQAPSEKNILQCVVMLCKRHRDMCMGDDDDKPVSILMTTLLTKAYVDAPGNTLWEILCWCANHLVDYIQSKNGRPVVLNPADSRENFADKWPDKPRKQQLFYGWVERLQQDLKDLLVLTGEAYKDKLKRMFGETITAQARSIEGRKIHDGLNTKAIGISASNGGITSSANSIPVLPHTNRGGRHIKPYPTPYAIPAQAQLKKMLDKYPTSTGTIARNGIRWVFDVQPTPKSRIYTIRVSYQLNQPPVIEIVKPTNLIREKEGTDFIHMFRDSNRGKQMLCLYTEGDWTSQKYIAETIVPWAAKWCYFYEVWLDTGEWHGGGYHKGEYRP